MSFDTAVVNDGHVVWQRLTASEQAALLVNYPCRPAATVPTGDEATGVVGDAVDPRFEQWLDQAYTLRHANDNIDEDPTQ